MHGHNRNNRMNGTMAEISTNHEPLPTATMAGSCEEMQLADATGHEHGVCGRSRPASRSRTILVPLTLSDGSHVALAIARNLARESGGKLVLLHVVHLNIVGEERGIQRTRMVNELCQDAERRLRQLADCLGEEAVTDVLVREGRPAETIVEAARCLQADTIVMHARGYRGRLRWLHANTALKVMRHAPCRVLLASTGRRRAAVNLTILGHSTLNRKAESFTFHESSNPFRSLLRVLFS